MKTTSPQCGKSARQRVVASLRRYCRADARDNWGTGISGRTTGGTVYWVAPIAWSGQGLSKLMLRPEREGSTPSSPTNFSVAEHLTRWWEMFKLTTLAGESTILAKARLAATEILRGCTVLAEPHKLRHPGSTPGPATNFDGGGVNGHAAESLDRTASESVPQACGKPRQWTILRETDHLSRYQGRSTVLHLSEWRTQPQQRNQITGGTIMRIAVPSGRNIWHSLPIYRKLADPAIPSTRTRAERLIGATLQVTRPTLLTPRPNMVGMMCALNTPRSHTLGADLSAFGASDEQSRKSRAALYHLPALVFSGAQVHQYAEPALARQGSAGPVSISPEQWGERDAAPENADCVADSPAWGGRYTSGSTSFAAGAIRRRTLQARTRSVVAGRPGGHREISDLTIIKAAPRRQYRCQQTQSRPFPARAGKVMESAAAYIEPGAARACEGGCKESREVSTRDSTQISPLAPMCLGHPSGLGSRRTKRIRGATCASTSSDRRKSGTHAAGGVLYDSGGVERRHASGRLTNRPPTRQKAAGAGTHASSTGPSRSSARPAVRIWSASRQIGSSPIAVDEGFGSRPPGASPGALILSDRCRLAGPALRRTNGTAQGTTEHLFQPKTPMEITKPGKYRLLSDFSTRGPRAIGQITSGTVLNITQCDVPGRKVLGPELFDWTHFDLPVEPVMLSTHGREPTAKTCDQTTAARRPLA